ncbi:hypothetical protein FYK26_24785 (plasmid) [Escherichia albertii]|nr:hypothetical protein FYK30_24770 [Escherichia albertii]QSZ91875.1 hypothetical protein FYK29_24775 [Escherichia albertii]QSZ96290.1 hypothetical protein FYK28_24805 [Escherichia albertii]QTA00694.1 hypothetical protein FYK27_24850 [Escherichia albertii]QTA05077.1 hypothetical protein FYK26_24785 [Escherichia albertii]
MSISTNIAREFFCPEEIFSAFTNLHLEFHYSLLTTHYSLLTTHYSLLTTHQLPVHKVRLQENIVMTARSQHWSVKPVMTRPVAKSKRLIRDIWVRRTRSM